MQNYHDHVQDAADGELQLLLGHVADGDPAIHRGAAARRSVSVESRRSAMNTFIDDYKYDRHVGNGNTSGNQKSQKSPDRGSRL